jgi:hypothetical protein
MVTLSIAASNSDERHQDADRVPQELSLHLR